MTGYEFPFVRHGVAITIRQPSPEEAAVQAARRETLRQEHDARMAAIMDEHVRRWGFWLGQGAVWADAALSEDWDE